MPDILDELAEEYLTGKPSNRARQRMLQMSEAERQIRQNRERFLARQREGDELDRLAAEYEWSQIENRQRSVDPGVSTRAEQLRSSGGMVGAATDAGFWGGIGQAALGAGSGLVGLAQTVIGDTEGADATYSEMDAYREARRRNTEEGLSSADLVPEFDASGGVERTPMALMQSDPSVLSGYEESRQGPAEEWFNRQIPGVAQSLMQSSMIPGLGNPSAIVRSAAQGLGFGAIQGAESASEARREGMSAADQWLYGLLMGGAEGAFPAAFEMAGMGGIERAGARPLLNAADDVLKSGFKGTAKEALKREAQEQAEENLTTIAQQYATSRMLPGRENAFDVTDENGNFSLSAPLPSAILDTMAQTTMQGRAVNAAEGAAAGVKKFQDWRDGRKQQAANAAIEEFANADVPTRKQYAALPEEAKIFGRSSTDYQREALAKRFRQMRDNGESDVGDVLSMPVLDDGMDNFDDVSLSVKPVPLPQKKQEASSPTGGGLVAGEPTIPPVLPDIASASPETGLVPGSVMDSAQQGMQTIPQGDVQDGASGVLPVGPVTGQDGGEVGQSVQSEPVGKSGSVRVPTEPGIGDVFPTTFNGKQMFALREPSGLSKSGYTDSLFNTEKEAREYADLKAEVAASNAEYEAKNKAIREKAEADEAARVAERKNLFGYEKMIEDAMQRGRAESVLNAPRKYEGREVTLKGLVKEFFDAGNVKLETEDDGKGGTRYFVNGRNLGKHAYDLAAYLEGERQSKEDEANLAKMSGEDRALMDKLFGQKPENRTEAGRKGEVFEEYMSPDLKMQKEKERIRTGAFVKGDRVVWSGGEGVVEDGTGKFATNRVVVTTDEGKRRYVSPLELAHAERTGFDDLPQKSQDIFNDAWVNGEKYQDWGQILDPVQKRWRGEFERRSGMKLPRSISGSVKVARAYFDGTKSSEEAGVDEAGESTDEALGATSSESGKTKGQEILEGVRARSKERGEGANVGGKQKESGDANDDAVPDTDRSEAVSGKEGESKGEDVSRAKDEGSERAAGRADGSVGNDDEQSTGANRDGDKSRDLGDGVSPLVSQGGEELGGGRSEKSDSGSDSKREDRVDKGVRLPSGQKAFTGMEDAGREIEAAEKEKLDSAEMIREAEEVGGKEFAESMRGKLREIVSFVKGIYARRGATDDVMLEAFVTDDGKFESRPGMAVDFSKYVSHVIDKALDVAQKTMKRSNGFEIGEEVWDNSESRGATIVGWWNVDGVILPKIQYRNGDVAESNYDDIEKMDSDEIQAREDANEADVQGMRIDDEERLKNRNKPNSYDDVLKSGLDFVFEAIDREASRSGDKSPKNQVAQLSQLTMSFPTNAKIAAVERLATERPHVMAYLKTHVPKAMQWAVEEFLAKQSGLEESGEKTEEKPEAPAEKKPKKKFDDLSEDEFADFFAGKPIQPKAERPKAPKAPKQPKAPKSDGTPKKPRKEVLKDDTKAALNDFKAEAQALVDLVKKLGGRANSIGGDTEIMNQIGRLAYKGIKAGLKTFRDFATYLIEVTSYEFVEGMMPRLRSRWDQLADEFEGFERTTDEDERAVLNGDDGRGTEGSEAASGEGQDTARVGAIPSGGNEANEAAGDADGNGEDNGGRTGRDGGESDSGQGSTTGSDLDGYAGRYRNPGRGTSAGNLRLGRGDGIGESQGKVETYNANVAAIKLLKQIEAEDRYATPEEKAVLVRYRGWGGVAEAFSTRKDQWPERKQELKELLSEDEHREARSSTQNAHYTSPEVIAGMWDGLKRAGFKGGRVLEPSVGVGHFIGMMPEGDSKVVMVEKDSITSRIARLLYPEAETIHLPYQEADTGKFDLIISNVPFAGTATRDRYDPELKKPNSLHNFFFLKAVRSLRPGGVVAFITSRHSMDAATSRGFREQVRDFGGRFIGAVRLPSNAFQSIAKTKVTTDVIFIQKDAGKEQDWFGLAKDEESGLPINEYFAFRPGNMLGKMSEQGGQHPGEYGLDPIPQYESPGAIGKALQEAIAKMPFDREALAKAMPESEYQVEGQQDAKSDDVEGRLVMDGENLLKVVDGKRIPMEWFGKKWTQVKEDQVKAYHGLIDLRNELSRLERDEMASDEKIDAARKKLNDAYDKAVEKWGFIGKNTNEGLMRNDDEYPVLVSLEDYDSEKQKGEKAAVFRERIEVPGSWNRIAPTTAEGAVIESYLEDGEVGVDRVAKLLGIDRDVAEREIESIAFRDPTNPESFVIRDLYLSGHVASKLKVAQEAAKTDDRFKANVEALKAALPKPKKAGEFVVRIRSPLVSGKHLQDFGREEFGFTSTIRHDPTTGSWSVDDVKMVDVDKFATADREAGHNEVLDKILNNRPLQVKDRDGYVDEVATANLMRRAREMEERFDRWAMQDEARKTEIENTYNETVGGFVTTKWNGEHLSFPGMAQTLKLMKHQKDAVWRGLVSGNMMLAHEVGLGKTYIMAALAMERKRMGLVRNQMLVVPNHLLAQVTSEFKQAYPSAKLLALAAGEINPDTRSILTHRVKSNSFDAVIVTKEAFKLIPMSKEYMRRRMNEIIEDIKQTIAEAQAAKGDNKNYIKRLEAMLESLETKMKDMLADAKKDAKAVNFEELGIDALYVDEAHEFRNLWAKTSMGRIPGVGVKGNQMTFDMLFKVDHINEKTGDRGVTFATGTPIANSISELWAMQRYLQPRALETAGVKAFDDWANMFGQVVTDIEVKPTGDGFRQMARFKRFANVKALTDMFRQIADVKYAGDVGLDKIRPEIRGGKAVTIEVQPSLDMLAYVRTLVKRMADTRRRGNDARIDNPLKVTTDGRKAALDLRLVGFDRDMQHSKVNIAVENVFKVWQEEKEVDGVARNGAQLLWVNLGTPAAKMAEARRKAAKKRKAEKRGETYVEEEEVEKDEDDEAEAERKEMEALEGGPVQLYDDIKAKLIAKGVPEKEIAFIHDYDSTDKKARLFKKVRKGEVRILISTVAKLATGANIQERLAALHFLDPPWKPADIEQAMGRAIRRGNKYRDWGGVRIFQYVTKGSFDARIWQLLEDKERAIRQLMDGAVDEVSDVGKIELNADEVKALAASNPKIIEMVRLRAEVQSMLAEQAGRDDAERRAKNEVEFQISLKKSRKEELEGRVEIAKRMPPKDEYDVEPWIEIKGRKVQGFEEIGKEADKAIVESSEAGFDVARIGTVNDGAVTLLAQREPDRLGGYAWVIFVQGMSVGTGVQASDKDHGRGMQVVNQFKKLYSVLEDGYVEKNLKDNDAKIEKANAAYKAAREPWGGEETLKRKRDQLLLLETELGSNADRGDDGFIPAVNNLTKFAIMAERLSEKFKRPVTAINGKDWVFGDMTPIPAGAFDSEVDAVDAEVAAMLADNKERPVAGMFFGSNWKSAGVVKRPGEGDRVPRGNRNYGQTYEAAGLDQWQGPVPQVNQKAFAQTPAESGKGIAMMARIASDIGAKSPKVGIRSVVEFLNDLMVAKLIVGKANLTKRNPAHYLGDSKDFVGPSIIRSVSGRADFNFHEAGHAMSNMLRDANPKVFRGLGKLLIGLTVQPGSMASAKTPEEGVAEFIRLFVKGHYIEPTLEGRMMERIEKANPEIAKGLRDAHRIWVAQMNRDKVELLKASVADRGAKKSAGAKSIDVAYKIAANTIGPSWVVNKLNRMAAAAIVGDTAARKDFTGLIEGLQAIAGAETAAKYGIYRNIKENLEDTQGDIENAYHARMRASSEAERVMGGAKRGREGVRFMNLGGGFANLSPAAIKALRSNGFEISDEAVNAKYGQLVWLSDKSFAKIRSEVGSDWDGFEKYAQFKAVLARPGQMFPAKAELGEDAAKRLVEEAEAANPTWVDRFKDVQKLMDQMLLLSVLSGEKTVDEAIRMKNKYEHYVPLNRELEEYEQYVGGNGDALAPTSAIFRVKKEGSEKPFMPLEDAVRLRARAAMRAFYEDATRKSVIAWQNAYAGDKRIDYAARKAIARTMLPLRPDVTSVATLSADEQKEIFAGLMNRAELARILGEDGDDGLGGMPGQSFAHLKDSRVSEWLEELGVTPLTAEDVSIAVPGKPVFRSDRPRTAQVVTTFENGEVRYWQVLDPQVYEFFASTPRANEYIEMASGLASDVSAPFKRAVVQNVAYGLINIGFRDALAAVVNKKKLSVQMIPGAVAAAAIINRLTGDKWGVADLGVADGLARGLNRAAGSPHRDDGKTLWGRVFASGKEMLGEGITDRDWSNPLKWLGGVAAIGTKVTDIFNWVTFGRFVSQWAETLSREGAAIIAMQDGASHAEAMRESDDVTGRFVQQGMSANAASFIKGFMFLNPQIQLWSQVTEQMLDPDPAVRRQLFTMKLPLIGVAGATSAAVYALAMAMAGDDEWEKFRKKHQERSEDDKLAYGHFIDFQVPFDTGVVGTTFSFGYNSVLDWICEVPAQEGRSRAVELLKRAADLPLPSEAGLHFSSGWSELVSGERANGTRIVPEHLEKQYPNNPELQKYATTGKLYQEIGKLANVSPLKARHALRVVYGGEMVRLMDAVQKMADGQEIEPRDRPVIGRLFASDPKGHGARSVINLHSLETKYDAAVGTLKAMGKGDDEIKNEMLTAISDELAAAHQAYLDVEKVWREHEKTPAGEKSAREEMLDAARLFVREKELRAERLGILGEDFSAEPERVRKVLKGTKNTSDQVANAYEDRMQDAASRNADARIEQGKFEKGREIRERILRQIKKSSNVRAGLSDIR